MDPFNPPKPATKRQQASAVNPFARALAETEHGFNAPKPTNPNNPFSEALARTGGQFPSNADDLNDNLSNAFNQPSPEDLQRQQEEMARQQKKEAMRRKMHDQINPTDLRDVYDAREQRVKEELEKTREDLKGLAQEIAKFRMDVDIAATKHVVTPGQEGTYYVSFFQQLRSFIMLLKQKVRSARTWMQQSQAKSNKKKQKAGKKPGLEIGGQSHEQGKTVFDMMHHERSNSYSGN